MFEQGSIWRKWDLHIHSKYSLEETAKLEIKEIFEKAIDSGISVVSITDHSNVDGLDEVWSVWDTHIYKGTPVKDQVDFLPGIEIRTEKGKHSVHTLIIFPKYFKNKKIDKSYLESDFLNPLGFTKAKIEEAGAGNYKNGLLNMLADFEKLSVQARALSGLVFIHAGTKDNGLETEMAHSATGASDYELLSSLGVEKEKIIKRWVDVCELPNSNEKNIEEKDFYLKTFGKPSVVFSDSHQTYDGTKFTWIKADPTFDGLKQITYEPDDRVAFCQDSPYSDRKKIFLSNVRFSGSKGFIIPDIKIPLNRELVAVIGGRGSGKSALLESLAFLNEAHSKEDQNKKKKIIEFYRNNVEGRKPDPGFSLSVDLVDKDGNIKPYEKRLNQKVDLGLPFLYIGQEQLSAIATDDIELTNKVCELLSIDITQFDKSSIVDNAREILSKIKNVSAEIGSISSLYVEYKDGDFVKWIDNLILLKEEQKKRITSKNTKDILGDISKALDRGIKLKDYKGELENLKKELGNFNINDRIAEVNKVDEKLYAEKTREIPVVDLSVQQSAVASRITEIDTEMISLRAKIVEKKKTLSQSGVKEDISVLTVATETLQNEISNATRNKEEYQRKVESLNLLKKARNNLYDTVNGYLNKLKSKIDDGSLEFLKSKEYSKPEEVTLFKKIIEGVGVEGAITFDQDAFCDFLLKNCVDKRTIKTVEDLKALIAKKDEDGRAKDITIEILSGWIKSGLDHFLDNDALNIRGSENLIDYLFTRWGEFLKVKTVVKLKDVPIEKLSVGQRGTLLLKIYLATASAKQIFIVDQPEDNLDNQFIMNELVPLIRQIKKSRQIILSTHNANLVVNADSEQVIVARLLDDNNNNDYISGGIENQEINNSIKEILEGGEDAFRKRESKYGMATRNH